MMWHGLFSIILSAILISTSFRYFLLTWGLKHSEPDRAALIAILEPVWTASLSVLILGEVMSAQNLLGCGLVFFGLLISRCGFLFPAKKQVVLS